MELFRILPKTHCAQICLNVVTGDEYTRTSYCQKFSWFREKKLFPFPYRHTQTRGKQRCKPSVEGNERQTKPRPISRNKTNSNETRPMKTYSRAAHTKISCPSRTRDFVNWCLYPVAALRPHCHQVLRNELTPTAERILSITIHARPLGNAQLGVYRFCP